MSDLLPAVHPELEVAELDDELVVYDPRVSQVHLLSGLSAVLLASCDGHTSRDEVLTDLHDVLGVEETEAGELLDRGLAELELFGLLDGSDPPPCLGCDG